MKNILAIQGSPRKNKNTDLMLDSVLSGIGEQDHAIRKLYAYDLNIRPCTSCYYCAQTGRCIIDDEMQELYQLFNDADAIIIASPLYFSHLSAPLKTIIDRCQMYWSSKYRLQLPSIDRSKKRTGLFICSAGDNYPNQFSGCEMTLDLFFKAINTNYKDNLFYSGTDANPLKPEHPMLKQGLQVGLDFFK